MLLFFFVKMSEFNVMHIHGLTGRIIKRSYIDK